MASELQIEANRRNAQRSTGPQTPEGKAAVRLNALKHGLTAQDAVIPGEDKGQFDELLNAYLDHLQPLDPVETLLVHQMVMSAWRLTRARAMEAGAYGLRLIDDRKDIDASWPVTNPAPSAPSSAPTVSFSAYGPPAPLSPPNRALRNKPNPRTTCPPAIPR